MEKRLLIGLLPLLAACSQPEKAAQQAQPTTQTAEQIETATPPSKSELFQRAVDRVLIATETVKGDCNELLGSEMMAAVQKTVTGQSAPVCGKLALSPDAARQIITIRYNEAQVVPWEGGGPFTSAIFSYGENALLTTLIFPTEEVLVLASN